MLLEYARSSGEQTASASIKSSRCGLVAVDLLPPTEGVAVLKIYDNASAASGNVLLEVKCDFGLNSVHKELNYPVFAANGLYAELVGTGASYVVRFLAG